MDGWIGWIGWMVDRMDGGWVGRSSMEGWTSGAIHLDRGCRMYNSLTHSLTHHARLGSDIHTTDMPCVGTVGQMYIQSVKSVYHNHPHHRHPHHS